MQLFSVIKEAIEAIEAKLCLVLMLLILGTLTVQGAIPARMLWLNTRQGGKVLNGLNARQSENFTEFPLKDSFKLLELYFMFL